MENNNENYLSDWLADKISDNQLQQLVSESDFLAFQKIKMTLENYSVSEPNLETNFAAVKEKLQAKKKEKTKSIIPIWSYAVAACLLISFGLYQLYFLSNEEQTSFGLTKTIVLKDDSKVTLNAKTKILYSNLFQFNRTLTLDGEAFFEVAKGRSFTVKTKLGEVKVLGTKFNVTALEDYFEVVCYEGKVSVEVNKKNTILTTGESVRFYDKSIENWASFNLQKPTWLIGETSFTNVPMKYVFAKFKTQYKVDVAFPEKLKGIKFTGSFTNTNIEIALQSICIPLHLKYSNSTDKKITISE